MEIKGEKKSSHFENTIQAGNDNGGGTCGTIYIIYYYYYVKRLFNLNCAG